MVKSSAQLSKVVPGSANPPKKDRLTTTLSIDGMTCAACTSTVENALSNRKGVTDVQVSLLMNRAEAVHDSSLVVQDLVDLIEVIGFDCTHVSTTAIRDTEDGRTCTASLVLEGMTCSSCSNCIENALNKKDGVTEASVNLTTEKASITYDSDVIGPRDLIKIVTEVGFGAKLDSGELFTDLEALHNSHIAASQQRLVSAACLMIPISVVMLNHRLVSGFLLPLLKLDGFVKCYYTVVGERLTVARLKTVVLLLLVMPIQLGVAWPFHRDCIKGLMRYSMGMSFLISFGTSTSFVYGVFAMLGKDSSATQEADGALVTSAMLITFVLLGKHLEVRLQAKSSRDSLQQ